MASRDPYYEFRFGTNHFLYPGEDDNRFKSKLSPAANDSSAKERRLPTSPPSTPPKKARSNKTLLGYNPKQFRSILPYPTSRLLNTQLPNHNPQGPRITRFPAKTSNPFAPTFGFENLSGEGSESGVARNDRDTVDPGAIKGFTQSGVDKSNRSLLNAEGYPLHDPGALCKDPQPSISKDIPDPKFIANLNRLDEPVDCSMLNALVEVANVTSATVNDPNAYLTIEKVAATRKFTAEARDRSKKLNWQVELIEEKNAQYAMIDAIRDLAAYLYQENLPDQSKGSQQLQEWCQETARDYVEKAIAEAYEEFTLPPHLTLQRTQHPPMVHNGLDLVPLWQEKLAAIDYSAEHNQDFELAHIILSMDLPLESLASNGRSQKRKMWMAQAMEEPKWKGVPSQNAITKEDVLRKMKEQTERSGIEPVTALGAVPGGMPSTIDDDVFPTSSMNRSNKGNHSPTPYIRPQYTPSKPKIVETFDPDETDEYHSDITMIDPSKAENNSRIPSPPPSKRPKKAKQAQHQYNGPELWMLDEGRSDAVAMAARNNHSGTMDDLMSRAPPMARKHGRPPKTTESNTAIPQLPIHMSAEGGSLERYDNYDRSDDFQRSKAERKIRDNEEMYLGLRDFEGKQRGWNGERESDRSKTIRDYHLEQDRISNETYHKADTPATTLKGKEPITPLKPRTPDYTGMMKEERTKAMGDHLEDGYKMLSTLAKQSEVGWDVYMEENSRIVKSKMMGRQWDPDAIKADILRGQRARTGSVPRGRRRAEHNTSGSGDLRDLKKRDREDDNVQEGGSGDLKDSWGRSREDEGGEEGGADKRVIFE